MTNRIRQLLEYGSLHANGSAQLRGPRQPSQRNLDIYAGVRTQGFTQEEMANQFGLSQTRVSQIVRQCDRWFATQEAATGDIREPADRRRLASHLDLQRLETIYTMAMRDHRRSQQKIYSSRSGMKDGRQWSDSTNRDAPVNCQPLRLALRAVKMMWELDERKSRQGSDEGGVNSVGQADHQEVSRESVSAAGEVASPSRDMSSAEDGDCKCGQEWAESRALKYAVLAEGGGEEESTIAVHQTKAALGKGAASNGKVTKVSARKGMS